MPQVAPSPLPASQLAAISPPWQKSPGTQPADAPHGSPAVASDGTAVHAPDCQSPGPCSSAPPQNFCAEQSSFVRQSPLGRGLHVPPHPVVTSHLDPFAHSTSSMQALPSGTLPENTVM